MLTEEAAAMRCTAIHIALAATLSVVQPALSAVPVTLSGTLPSGTSFVLKIEEAYFEHQLNDVPDDGSIWGVDHRVPRSIVQKFEFRLSGKSVYVPRKLYTDLSHIRKAKVTEGTDGIVQIELQGSDAAGSYISDFLIRRNRVIERTTRAGEFPNEVWEKIILHNDLLDHPEKY